jgi:alcohol dehydrogenase class IV
MTSTFPAGSETVFTYGAPLLKFGTGAADEIGYDLSQDGARRVLVVTDPGIAATGLAARVADQMRRYDVEAEVYDGVHVEPTDASRLFATKCGSTSQPGGPVNCHMTPQCGRSRERRGHRRRG